MRMFVLSIPRRVLVFEGAHLTGNPKVWVLHVNVACAERLFCGWSGHTPVTGLYAGEVVHVPGVIEGEI
jgi:hypothetical protein